MKLERLYTIPLGKALKAARHKRVPRAVKIIREFVARHMKARGLKISLSQALNEHLWERSIQKPPRRVSVRLVKEDSVVNAYLPAEKSPEVKTEKTQTPKTAEVPKQSESSKPPEPQKTMEVPKPKEKLDSLEKHAQKTASASMKISSMETKKSEKKLNA